MSCFFVDDDGARWTVIAFASVSEAGESRARLAGGVWFFGARGEMRHAQLRGGDRRDPDDFDSLPREVIAALFRRATVVRSPEESSVASGRPTAQGPPARPTSSQR